ncbi:MAG: hypothetical protein KDC70_07870 [Saprospiraceae bacterium]|nr:hypothetical protein [Saprospiraceae bacterium]
MIFIRKMGSGRRDNDPDDIRRQNGSISKTIAAKSALTALLLPLRPVYYSHGHFSKNMGGLCRHSVLGADDTEPAGHSAEHDRRARHTCTETQYLVFTPFFYPFVP